MKCAIVKSPDSEVVGRSQQDTRADETGNPATDLPNMAMILQGITIRLSQHHVCIVKSFFIQATISCNFMLPEPELRLCL